MKNYTITVNGVAYDVTVEENNGAVAAPAAPVKKPAPAAAPVPVPAPAPAAKPAAPAAPKAPAAPAKK